jgi:hypothetical protein
VKSPPGAVLAPPERVIRFVIWRPFSGISCTVRLIDRLLERSVLGLQREASAWVSTVTSAAPTFRPY